jgi:hypothetical protein
LFDFHAGMHLARKAVMDDFTPEDAAPWPERTGKAEPRVAEPPPVPTEAPKPAAGSRRELLLGGLVVMATGAVTLAMLVAGGHPPAAEVSASSGTPSAGMTSNGRATNTGWTAAAPRWTANPSAWLGRNKGVAYEVSSSEPIGVWMRAVRPALVARCMGKQAEVFVFTDSAATIEANTEDHSVTFAFDGDEATSMRWPDGAEHNALFAPDGAATLRRLMHAETFTFRFTPHNAAPVTVRFNTQGLSELLKPAAKHCGW